MKKTLYTVTVLIIIIATSAFITESKPKLYKNLKVLPKDITKPELDSIMKSFTASLGVKCTFCHVKKEEKWYFELDASPNKVIARKMILMTNKINKKYFTFSEEEREKMETEQTELNQIITCYTCHRGQNKPVPSPQPQMKKPD